MNKMDADLSPKYIMALIEKVGEAIWDNFKTYKKAGLYINRWHYADFDCYGNGDENFVICNKEDGNIDLLTTLHNMDGETILKIAIDLGIETPGFIPCVPMFKNTLKDKYKSAIESFNTAISNIEDKPDLAISLANSTLESIIKEIISDNRLDVKYDPNMTLGRLVESILKEFKFHANLNLPTEIRGIGSSLINACKRIEELRSDKTNAHGKISTDYIVDDPLYAYFIVNSVTTVGLFLDSYYKGKFKTETLIEESQTYIPMKKNVLPF